MRILARILLFLGGAAGLYVAWIGFDMARGIIALPDQWMGTGDSDSIFLWLYISGLAAGFIGLVGLLAWFGAVFGPKRRKGAFWLLVLPGVLGLLTAITATVLIVVAEPESMGFVHWVAIGLGVTPLLSLVFGIGFRRGNPRRVV